jgi:hypothetical protein
MHALADRIIWTRRGRQLDRHPYSSARSYLRIPALGSGLPLLGFLPGIVEQGASTYLVATGQTQQPYLGRWLLLTAAMFGASAVAYFVRAGFTRGRARWRVRVDRRAC